MKIKEAAKILNINIVVLRHALQQQKIPIGIAVKNKKRWTYWINPEQVKNYKEGVLKW